MFAIELTKKNMLLLKNGQFIKKGELILDTRVLQYCIELSQHLNFTKVAESNFITQQALSQAIISLENQLGYKLFIRSNRSVKITPAGKAFVDKIALGLKNINDAVNIGHLYADGKCGEISISFTGSSAVSVLRDIIAGFAMKNPGVALNIHACTYKEAFRELDANISDIAFIPYLGQDIDGSVYNIEIRPAGNFHICVHKDHRLAKKEIITPNDLLNDVLITTDFKTTEIQKLITEDMYSFLGGEPKKYIKVPDNVSKSLLVEAGYGYSMILSDLEVSPCGGNVVIREIACVPHIRNMALVWRKDSQNALISLVANKG